MGMMIVLLRWRMLMLQGGGARAIGGGDVYCICALTHTGIFSSPCIDGGAQVTIRLK